MRKTRIFIFLLILYYSCTSRNEIIFSKINFLVDNINEGELLKIMGYSATYNYGGVDEVGNKTIKDIMYRDSLNNLYTIPSFQTKSKNVYDLSSYYKCINKNEQEGDLYAKHIANELINIITKYDLYSITSSGKNQSIGFHFTESISICYVNDPNAIFGELAESLNGAFLIKPKWYLLKNSKEAISLINFYRKSK